MGDAVPQWQTKLVQLLCKIILRSILMLAAFATLAGMADEATKSAGLQQRR
jgi:hypothetical protein